MLSWANALIPFHRLGFVSAVTVVIDRESPTQLCALRIQGRRDRGGIALLRNWKLETHWTPQSRGTVSASLRLSPLCRQMDGWLSAGHLLGRSPQAAVPSTSMPHAPGWRWTSLQSHLWRGIHPLVTALLRFWIYAQSLILVSGTWTQN